MTLVEFILIAILRELHYTGRRFFCGVELSVTIQQRSEKEQATSLLFCFAKPFENIQCLPGLLNSFLAIQMTMETSVAETLASQSQHADRHKEPKGYTFVERA